jgi:hypothetical protein
VGSWHHHQLKGKVEIVEYCLELMMEEPSGSGAERHSLYAVRCYEFEEGWEASDFGVVCSLTSVVHGRVIYMLLCFLFQPTERE